MTPNALRTHLQTLSLPEVNGTISVRKHGSFWRKFISFLGPGYLVAVGYMDPGNWATALAGGSQFGYTLLSICLISNIMAIILQSLCVRLGIATGRDLAQACRDHYSKPVSFILWILAELAICATDLAEVIGTAIGLYLLFQIPMEWGVLITGLDVFLVLALQRLGFRWVEAFIITLLIVIFGCFAVQVWLAQPDVTGILNGFIPSSEIITNPAMLYIALGIIGATVMPHNLYLHSSIVQTRAIEKDDESKKSAIRYASMDSTIALMLALTVNASILILAAATFHSTGHQGIAELQDAHSMLIPLLGTSMAATLFAVALLCCGLNSTVTATLSGQIVMEGFINIRLAPWLRRIITRGIAIVPAMIVTILYGQSGTAQLLIFSQVILSLQLPFAVVPLVLFTRDKIKMGNLTAPLWMTTSAAIIAVILITLNIKMIWDTVTAL
ncbi:MAG: divalent metal cation transporter [Alphaproteobacteria bacterium CG1_02_46_17]|nr:MAG: divalent metal cation transporter [Alphaproteobacteria bacterium CG1_02_46_17]